MVKLLLSQLDHFALHIESKKMDYIMCIVICVHVSRLQLDSLI